MFEVFRCPVGVEQLHGVGGKCANPIFLLLYVGLFTALITAARYCKPFLAYSGRPEQM